MTKEEIITETKMENETPEVIEEEAKTEEVVVEMSNEEKYLGMLQRLQAEFDNFAKRTQKEKGDIIKNANFALISDFIPILDDFELSLQHNDDVGVKMIHDSLLRTLKKQGMTEIATDGVFNPNIHEVLSQEEGEEDGVILEVFQKGYMLNERLLRAAKVKISKNMEKQDE
ncbi:MAG: molecular chaperone GrpE [Patescibacteria group bacterium]|jgi:molecular chaperone GrpE